MPNYYPWFILASALLMLTPGPNVALIVANSVGHGARFGLLTVFGTVVATTIHLALFGFGLEEALGVIGIVFEWVRWAGVAYLVYLGIDAWRAPASDLVEVGAQRLSAPAMVLRAFAVGLTNPKTLLFYGAFFPQFLAPSRPLAPQLWVLCLTFLVVSVVIDGGWALVAARARLVLRRYGRLRNRITGGLLMGAGLGLALAGRR